MLLWWQSSGPKYLNQTTLESNKLDLPVVLPRSWNRSWVLFFLCCNLFLCFPALLPVSLAPVYCLEMSHLKSPIAPLVLILFLLLSLYLLLPLRWQLLQAVIITVVTVILLWEGFGSHEAFMTNFALSCLLSHPIPPKREALQRAECHVAPGDQFIPRSANPTCTSQRNGFKIWLL